MTETIPIPIPDATPVTLENVCQQVAKLKNQMYALSVIVGTYFIIHFTALAVGVHI